MKIGIHILPVSWSRNLYLSCNLMGYYYIILAILRTPVWTRNIEINQHTVTEFKFQPVYYPPQNQQLAKWKDAILPQKKFIFPIFSGAFALSLRESLIIQTPPEVRYLYTKSIPKSPNLRRYSPGCLRNGSQCFFSLPFRESIQTLTGGDGGFKHVLFQLPTWGNSIQFRLKPIFFQMGVVQISHQV